MITIRMEHSPSHSYLCRHQRHQSQTIHHTLHRYVNFPTKNTKPYGNNFPQCILKILLILYLTSINLKTTKHQSFCDNNALSPIREFTYYKHHQRSGVRCKRNSTEILLVSYAGQEQLIPDHNRKNYFGSVLVPWQSHTSK